VLVAKDAKNDGVFECRACTCTKLMLPAQASKERCVGSIY